MGIVGRSRRKLEAWQQSKNRKQVSASESRLIPLERFSDKLKKVNQVAVSSDSEQEVNPNSQPESPNF
jgi:hypothetical protein